MKGNAYYVTEVGVGSVCMMRESGLKLVSVLASLALPFQFLPRVAVSCSLLGGGFWGRASLKCVYYTVCFSVAHKG